MGKWRSSEQSKFKFWLKENNNNWNRTEVKICFFSTVLLSFYNNEFHSCIFNYFALVINHWVNIDRGSVYVSTAGKLGKTVQF